MYYAFNIKVAGLARRRKFPLFISQDGTPVHEATQQQAQSYEEVGSYFGWKLCNPLATAAQCVLPIPATICICPLDMHW